MSTSINKVPATDKKVVILSDITLPSTSYFNQSNPPQSIEIANCQPNFQTNDIFIEGNNSNTSFIPVSTYSECRDVSFYEATTPPRPPLIPMKQGETIDLDNYTTPGHTTDFNVNVS
ncbi:hypothetical protein FQR65_LT18858 [Abscondita terminalis]|nr:hypothetical protein FQR65_LT18858 [Abscondita terminalis]